MLQEASARTRDNISSNTLTARIERIQMLREVASQTRSDACDTADRLFGCQPEDGYGVSGAPEPAGLLAVLDTNLDELERELRGALAEVGRLTVI